MIQSDLVFYLGIISTVLAQILLVISLIIGLKIIDRLRAQGLLGDVEHYLLPWISWPPEAKLYLKENESSTLRRFLQCWIPAVILINLGALLVFFS